MCIQAFQKLKASNGFGILSNLKTVICMIDSVKAKIEHEASMFSPHSGQFNISPGFDSRYNRKVIKYDSEFNLVREARSRKEDIEVTLQVIEI